MSNNTREKRLLKIAEEMSKIRERPSTATAEEVYDQMDRALRGETYSREDNLIRTEYNTGDQIWTSYRDGVTKVVRVITHDGVFWEEGMSSLGSIKQSPLGGGGVHSNRTPWFSSLSSKLAFLKDINWWKGLWYDFTDDLFGVFITVFIVTVFVVVIKLLLLSL